MTYPITAYDDAEKNCPTVGPGVNQRMHWSFEDPVVFEGTPEEKLANFCEIHGQIEQRIQVWLEEQSLPLYKL